MPLPRYYQDKDFAEFQHVFTQRCKTVHFRKGDYLKAPNTEITHLYYIVNGLTKATMLHESGGLKTTFIVGPGCIQPLFYPAKFPIWEKVLGIEAYTNLTALEMTKDKFYQFSLEFPDLLEIMLNVTARNAYTLAADILSFTYSEGITRICNFLYHHLYNLDVTHNHDVRLMKTTQNDLGAVVGLTRENTNKILRQLQKEKIIAIEWHRIKIIDEKSLLDYCSQDRIIGE